MPQIFYDWLPAKPAMSPQRPITSQAVVPSKLPPTSIRRPFSTSSAQSQRKRHIFLPPPRLTTHGQRPVYYFTNQLGQLYQLMETRPDSINQQRQLQMLRCENLVLLLEQAQQDMPYLQSLLSTLKQGVEDYKPKADLVDQEMQEMLAAHRTADDSVNIDLSGLARVLVKKRREVRALEQRNADIKTQLADTLKQRRLSLEAQEVLDREIAKYERIVQAKQQIGI